MKAPIQKHQKPMRAPLKFLTEHILTEVLAPLTFLSVIPLTTEGSVVMCNTSRSVSREGVFPPFSKHKYVYLQLPALHPLFSP